MLGDLVDFSGHGISDAHKHNNWRIFQDIVLGFEKKGAGNGGASAGLKVPLFSSTGNHDWRLFPYRVTANASAFGLTNKAAKGVLDQFWADDQGEVSAALKKFFDHMIAEGSLLSNVMLGGKYLHQVGDVLRKLRDRLRGPTTEGKVRGNLADWLLPRFQKWQVQVLAPLAAGVVPSVSGKIGALLMKIPLVGPLGEGVPATAAVAMATISGFINGSVGVAKFLVRWRAPDLMALEADRKALRDYFLFVNPYYNYAFRLGKNYFLLLDTGYDCLRAQRFWDDGRKKLGPVSIRDNILGGSPDSMGFWAANEFYPYGQITWIERLLEHIAEKEGRQGGGVSSNSRTPRTPCQPFRGTAEGSGPSPGEWLRRRASCQAVQHTLWLHQPLSQPILPSLPGEGGRCGEASISRTRDQESRHGAGRPCPLEIRVLSGLGRGKSKASPPLQRFHHKTGKTGRLHRALTAVDSPDAGVRPPGERLSESALLSPDKG